MQSFVQLLRNLGPVRLVAMGGVVIGLLAFMLYFGSQMSSPNMKLLYGELNLQDSKTVSQRLEEMGVPYEMRANGTEIYVPGDQALNLRVQLADAAQGGASLGYEVFDQQDALASTNFMQNVNLLRALEGELSRTIRAIDGVKSARVHLVLPKREMFTRETQKPSASIVIGMKSGQLNSGQVQAIQSLVAAAVPRLEPGDVALVDDRGNLLASAGQTGENMRLNRTEEMRRAYEQRLSRSIEALLANTLGPDKVRAEVSAEMNFDRVVTNEEIFDPDQQVVRSTTTIEENAQTNENEPPAVTVQQNLPNPNLDGEDGATASSQESRVEETTNYEIGRRVVNQTRETGQVERLSVAVVVDGIYQEPVEEGQARTYQPRTEDEMDKIGAIVRSAIGYDGTRGDQVEVINMRFAGLEPAVTEPQFVFLGFTKDELMRMAEGLGVAVVAILVILLVVRPLVTRAFESLPAPGEAAGRQLLSGEASGVAALPGSAPTPSGAPPDELEDELIDISQVEGRVKASSLKKIGEIVEKHPEEALGIVRSWLYQEGG